MSLLLGFDYFFGFRVQFGVQLVLMLEVEELVILVFIFFNLYNKGIFGNGVFSEGDFDYVGVRLYWFVYISIYLVFFVFYK